MATVMPMVITLLGVLQITAYRPVPEQTKPSCIDRWHCTTSIGDGVTIYGAAVSQDLLKSGTVHYGDVLLVEGFGFRIVNDAMNARITNAVDLMVLDRDHERAVGIRHRRVWLVKEECE